MKKTESDRFAEDVKALDVILEREFYDENPTTIRSPLTPVIEIDLPLPVVAFDRSIGISELEFAADVDPAEALDGPCLDCGEKPCSCDRPY